MISKHCKKPLHTVKSHKAGYNAGEHVWQCDVCKKIFRQKIRLGKERYRNVWGTIVNLNPEDRIK